MKPVNPPVFVHIGIITVTVIATNDEGATGKRKGFQGVREVILGTEERLYMSVLSR
jgi:hypothetical protein